MRVSEVSIAAYRAIPNLVERQHRVLDCIRRNPHASYIDVSEITGMIPSNAASRINELVNDGRIVSSGKKINPATGRKVTTYCVTIKSVAARGFE